MEGDFASWAYMVHEVRNEADLQAWVDQRIAGGIAYLIRDDAGNPVGSTSIFDVVGRTMEVGHTWIAPAARRTKVNTQTKRIVLERCFERMDAMRVQLKCDARNEQSRRAILRIGATYEGTLRHTRILPDGHRRDVAIFSILEHEWPRVKARLDSGRDAFKGPHVGATQADMV